MRQQLSYSKFLLFFAFSLLASFMTSCFVFCHLVHCCSGGHCNSNNTATKKTKKSGRRWENPIDRESSILSGVHIAAKLGRFDSMYCSKWQCIVIFLPIALPMQQDINNHVLRHQRPQMIINSNLVIIPFGAK